MAAKCKKGKKGKKQPKQSGIEWAKSFEVMPFDSSVLRPLASDAASAFEGRTGKPLDESLVGVSEMPKALWKAPICVMVVGAGDDGATVSYANDAACEFAGKKHTELIGSETVLPATVADGYDSSYEKKVDGRTMQKAKRWSISKMAVVDGELVTEDQGVGYAFSAWIRDEDGALCKPGGIVEAGGPIDPAAIQALIDTQAAAVRDLKELDAARLESLGNKCPKVVEAVAELLRLKALLEE